MIFNPRPRKFTQGDMRALIHGRLVCLDMSGRLAKGVVTRRLDNDLVEVDFGDSIGLQRFTPMGKMIAQPAHHLCAPPEEESS